MVNSKLTRIIQVNNKKYDLLSLNQPMKSNFYGLKQKEIAPQSNNCTFSFITVYFFLLN